MITANIVRDTAHLDAYDAVLNGLELVGEQLGGIEVLHHLRDKAVLGTGEIYQEHFGFNRFDPDVDLHLYVTDRTISTMDVREQQRRTARGLFILGESFYFSGTGVVDTKQPLEALPHVVAHEVAHSLGFVTLVAPHSVNPRTHEPHCRNNDCLMYPTVDTEDKAKLEAAHFCSDCSDEMHKFGHMNLNFIRGMRRRDKTVRTRLTAPDLEDLLDAYETVLR